MITVVNTTAIITTNTDIKPVKIPVTLRKVEHLLYCIAVVWSPLDTADRACTILVIILYNHKLV